MKRVIGIAGSNSSTSINSQLVNYVLGAVQGLDVKEIKLTDYKIPMYNIDTETEQGIPIDVKLLQEEIKKASGIVISVNEHNGSLSAFFKNILDWLSRSDRNFLEGKKILLMSTSPGGRGAAGALEYAKQTFPRFGAQIAESFSFPSFHENFNSSDLIITNPTLDIGVKEVLASFLQELD